MTVKIMNGDCLVILPTLAAASIESCVTDPPYGLSFMGKNGITAFLGFLS